MSEEVKQKPTVNSELLETTTQDREPQDLVEHKTNDENEVDSDEHEKEQDENTENTDKTKLETVVGELCEKARQEKIERMKLLRKKKKEARAAKKLAAQPEEPHLTKVLEALETSFDGKEFEVLMRIVQPKLNDIKSSFYRIRADLQDALLRYYPQVDIQVFGSCVTDMAFNGKFLVL